MAQLAQDASKRNGGSKNPVAHCSCEELLVQALSWETFDRSEPEKRDHNLPPTLRAIDTPTHFAERYPIASMYRGRDSYGSFCCCVETANSVSPSDVVCVGLIAIASPSWAICTSLINSS